MGDSFASSLAGHSIFKWISSGVGALSIIGAITSGYLFLADLRQSNIDVYTELRAAATRADAYNAAWKTQDWEQQKELKTLLRDIKDYASYEAKRSAGKQGDIFGLLGGWTIRDFAEFEKWRDKQKGE